MTSCPEIGQLVVVRKRPFVVTEIVASAPGLAPSSGRPSHLIKLSSVEDDGIGADPDRIRRILSGDTTIDSIGVANVDERLRSVYGDGYGLVIETAPGAGTKVTVRVPKFQPQALA